MNDYTPSNWINCGHCLKHKAVDCIDMKNVDDTKTFWSLNFNISSSNSNISSIAFPLAVFISREIDIFMFEWKCMGRKVSVNDGEKNDEANFLVLSRVSILYHNSIHLHSSLFHCLIFSIQDKITDINLGGFRN